MAHYVHVHVSFHCNNNDGVAALAQKHARLLDNPEGNNSVRDAQLYLADLAKRTGDNLGWKGGLSLWGMISNHLDPAIFMHALEPFFRELLYPGVEGGPTTGNYIVGLFEHEGAGSAEAIEVQIIDPWPLPWSDQVELVSKHYKDLPFSWNQN